MLIRRSIRTSIRTSSPRLPDYLLGAVYFPRTLAYLLAAIMTFSRYSAEPDIPSYIGVLLLVCLVYPHLIHWVCIRWINSSIAARNSMTIDALIVALLIIANGYDPTASLFLISSLSISSLIISRAYIMLICWCIVCLVCLLAWTAGAPELSEMTSLTHLFSTVFIVVYSSVVAYKVYGVTTAMGGAKRQYRRKEQQLTSMTERLAKYLSPQVFSVLQQISGKESSSTRKRLTVFFSDIEGFTALMDSLEEELVTELLNEYLNSMAEIAIRHGGTVDKFMGDGIMIFFGDPMSQGSKQDALACVRMALDMRGQLKVLRQKWHNAKIFSDLTIRIGIHTGHCTVGNFGSDTRMDYTAIGSTVNLASRLETCAASDQILISEQTYRLISMDIECKKLPAREVKGIRRMIQTYQVVGEEYEASIGIIEKQCPGLVLTINPRSVDVAVALKLLAEVDQQLQGLSK